jgi:outer membrane protein assembly factor BamA
VNGSIARALLLAALASLLARGAGAAAAPRVVTIVIDGASRSNRETILRLARVHEGDSWHEGLDAEARQFLMNAGIFYEIAVTATPVEGGVRLRIALKDKWTLIPIPLVVVKDDETTWGGTLIESNLFGTGTMLIGFLAVQGGEPSGALMYIDPRVRGTRYQLFGALGHTDERVSLWDADEETGSYRRQTTGGIISVGYRFLRRTSIALGLRVTDFSFGEPGQQALPPAAARERAVSLVLRHDGIDADEDQRRGFSADVRFEAGASILGDEVGRTSALGTARWAVSPFDGHTLSFTGHGLWADTADYEAGRPASAFLRGYESNRFAPDRLLGGTLEYRIPLARIKTATLSLVPFADAALLRDRFHRFAFEDAQADAGVALAVYLRRVALPLLQFYGAYGFTDGRVLTGFSLGAMF